MVNKFKKVKAYYDPEQRGWWVWQGPRDDKATKRDEIRLRDVTFFHHNRTGGRGYISGYLLLDKPSQMSIVPVRAWFSNALTQWRTHIGRPIAEALEVYGDVDGKLFAEMKGEL